MPITALPTAPSRARPATFSAEADALLGALPTFVDELNAVAIGESAAGLALTLAGTGSGQGSSLIGVQDAGNYWSGTTVESVDQEIGALFKNQINPYLAPFGMAADYNESTFLGTDNATALQAAIDYAHSQGGGVIWLHGQNMLRSGITLKGGVFLASGAMRSDNLTTSERTPCALHFLGTGYDGVTVGVLGNSSLHKWAGLSGLTIYGNNGIDYGVVAHAALFSMSGVSVTKTRKSNIVLNGSIALLRDVLGTFAGMHGCEVLSSDIRIEGCEMQQPNNSAIGLTANTYDCWYITGGTCQMVNGRSGDDAMRSRHNINVDGGNLTLLGWDVSASVMTGLRLNNSAGSVVMGCRFITSSANASSCGISIENASASNVITGNVFNKTAGGTGIGAIQVLSTAADSVSITSNVGYGAWAPSTSTTSDIFLVATNAVRDGATNCRWENGQSRRKHNQGKTISGATPNINTTLYCDFCNVNNAGATTMTDMLGGVQGDEVTLFFVNTNTTLQHLGGGNLRLSAGVNFNPPANYIMKFMKFDSLFLSGVAAWHETFRGQA